MGADDDVLVEHAQSDPAAFAKLYRRYLTPVYRYVFARIGNVADAEDLTSQVFLAALEALPRYQGSGRFSAWLFSIARRKVADHYRARRAQAPLEAITRLPASGDDPLEQVAADEELRELARRIGRLHEDERELLRLRFAAQLSFAEIAALLKRKPSAVKMSLYRLLERLESQMESGNE
jgi:RNA polymerase sigma-70 factor (ECF subfamily)